MLGGLEQPDRVRAEWLHAVVSRWFDGSDHDSQRKAWVVSPVRPMGDRGVGVEVGVLDDALAKRVGDVFVDGPVPVRLGREAVLADARRRDESGAPEPFEVASWQELWDGAGPGRRWEFEFLTPTTFRSGQRYQPLPVANSVFGHLQRLWKVFGPHVPDVDLGAEPLVVEQFAGSSRVMALRRRDVPGFVGRVVYVAPPGVTSQARLALDRCARLAPLAGVGSHTTSGFGVVALA